MQRNYKLNQKLLASIVLVNFFLQSCGNSPNQFNYQEKEVKRNEIHSPSTKIRKGLDLALSFQTTLLQQLPSGYELGEAYGDGDCFFDALAQWINKINHTDVNTGKYLRMLCHEFYQENKKLVADWELKDNGEKAASEDKYDQYEYVYSKIQYTADECDSLFNQDICIWGRPWVEGIILCRKVDLRCICFIEVFQEPITGNPVISYHIVDRDGYKSSMSEEAGRALVAEGDIPILVNAQGKLHFVPLWKKDETLKNQNKFKKAEEVQLEKGVSRVELEQIKKFNLLTLKDLAFNKSLEFLASKSVEEIDSILDKTKSGNGNINFPSEIANELRAAINSRQKVLCDKEHKEEVQQILEKVHDPFLQEKDEKKKEIEVLVDAINDGNLEKVKEMFDQTGINVNLPLKNNGTALMLAALNGHESIVDYLVKVKGADVHYAVPDGFTALITAAYMGHCNVVKYLLSKQSNRFLSDHVDKRGLSAFLHAVNRGKLEVVKYFAELPNFNPQIEGTVALSLAASNKHDEIVEFLISKGVCPLPKQDNLANSKGIFYNPQINNDLGLEYFDIIAYTSLPISKSNTIPSLSQETNLNIYQVRVLEQSGYQENCIQKQLELAVNKLGGTKAMHRATSPIFGGTCSYHAIKNALIGLMLLHDYDMLAHTEQDSEEIKAFSHLVSEDIKCLTTLKTKRFDSEDFMEKIHAKMFVVQHEPFLKKLEPINIQQGGSHDRMHIAYPEFDVTLNTLLAKHDKNFQPQNSPSLSFIDVRTINCQKQGYLYRRTEFSSIKDFFHNNEYATLYQNANMSLNEIISTIQTFDLASQIARFRTNANYRHAFILSLNTATLDGYGLSLSDHMHAITVILDKRDSIVNVIIFESNNIADFAIKQILFDFINLFTDENIHMPDELRNDLVLHSANPYGFELTNYQNKLPSFESLVSSYAQLKEACYRNQERDDAHKAFFFLSKINHVYMTAKHRAKHGIDQGEFNMIQEILAKYDQLHQENKLREEEISLYAIIQAIEEKELNKRMHGFIMEGDVLKVQETLKIGANPNETHSNGNTPLHIAVYKNLDMVKCLIEKGAKVDLSNKQGQTSLMLAVEQGNCEIIDFLIQHGADVNAKDENGCTPLMYSANIWQEGKRLEIVKFLIEQCKADISLTNNSGQTVLMVHAIAGSMDIFHYLLNEHNLTIDLKSLVKCIAHEKVELANCFFGPLFNSIPLIEYCIKELNLTAQAHPDIILDLAISAAKNYRFDVIKRLCQNDCGFNINAQDAAGWTILMHICEDDNIHLLKQIIDELQPDINAKNNAVQNAFDIASKRGSLRVLDYFIKKHFF